MAATSRCDDPSPVSLIQREPQFHKTIQQPTAFLHSLLISDKCSNKVFPPMSFRYTRYQLNNARRASLFSSIVGQSRVVARKQLHPDVHGCQQIESSPNCSPIVSIFSLITKLRFEIFKLNVKCCSILSSLYDNPLCSS